MARIYVGDYGTVIRVNTSIDLTLATSMKLEILKPGASVAVEKTLTLPVSGYALTDGVVEWFATEGFFDVAGVYKIQPVITFSASEFRGQTASFTVYEEWT